MSDLIDRSELLKALNKVSMEHHETGVPMVEHDFRELIVNSPVVDTDKDYAEQMKEERVEMGVR